LLFSPFEQFEINVLFAFPRLPFFTYTNLSSYLCLAIMCILFITYVSTMKKKLVPSLGQYLIEKLYLLVLDIVLNQAGAKALKYFPLFFTVFFFILCINLLSLTPFAFTPTAHCAVTFLLSFGLFLSWIIIGFQNHGTKFLKIFSPKDVPSQLKPLLIVIEVMSFLIRPVSLSLRLFANLLAGHILLFLCANGTLTLANINIFFAFIPFIFSLAFLILEIGVAFLQAYVFTVMLAIYLSDSL